MDETRHIYKQITVTSSIDSGQHGRSNSTIDDTSFYTKTHAEKADLLSQLYSPSGEKENATTDVGHIAQSAIEYVPTRNGVHTNSATISYLADRQNTNSEAYIKIMRAHYTQEILQALQKVQAHAGMPSASVYINKILQTIQKLEEKSPTDPVLEVLFAFYDALAYNGLWATYTIDQYRSAERTLVRVVNETVNAQKIEKAIAALDTAGFETLPYSFSLDVEDDA